jgi:hypothetical protein
VLFSADAWPGLADGSITLTFRTWQRALAKVGGLHRIAGLQLEIIAVDQVEVGSITLDDARAAGATDLAGLLARLGDPEPSTLVFRVAFRAAPDDRLARGASGTPDDDEVAAIRARLARFDRTSTAGPWTTTTLRLVDRYPGVVSTVLARHTGRERAAFKVDVRKLKELGLTESLGTGYRLTPLGLAVLHAG